MTTTRSSELSRTAAVDRSTASSLSISIVVYHPDMALLAATCRSLGAALRVAHEQGVLSHANVDVVDNGSNADPTLDVVLHELGEADWLCCQMHRGGGNVGYGRGHNGPLLASDADLHLVLNPDVCLTDDSLVRAIRFMQRHPDVGLLTPRVTAPSGELQRLCRRYPTLFVLYLRGFAPDAVRRRFRHHLDEYEMADVVGDRDVRRIPLASGCFMLLRLEVARVVGGFSPEFFLYFEDHDLSLKIGRHADIAYVPSVRIVHHGGGASRKGMRHILLYVSSARRFFSKHGWRLW